MTVIIFARASNGIVIAGDGRTRYTNPPRIVDDARKVRVHHVGASGLITASSGRATIGTTQTIADAEEKFFNDLPVDSGCPRPEELAEHLRKTIEDLNLSHICNCASNLGECLQIRPCANCYRTTPSCAECPTEPVYEWADEEECLCSPGRYEPASKPSRYEGKWCRCKARPDDYLTWLCVPFGPTGYGQPVTTKISGNHETKIPPPSPVQDHVLVQGELRSQPHIAIIVKSATVNMAEGYATTDLVDLDSTVERVRELLRTAYSEAPASALLKTLKDKGYTPGNLGLEALESITMKCLAAKVRKYEEEKGFVAQDIVSTIGGTATYATIDAAGNASQPQELTL